MFESPHRLAGLLAWLAEVAPDRTLCVCRELTKLHEQVVRGTPARVAAALGAPRGEVTLVIDPPAPATAGADDDGLASAAGLLRAAGLGAGQAADVLAALGAAPRNRAYRAAVEASGAGT
jgi:16S rRNA (cytidine1402-2'-O)-methyltransferase